MKYLFARKVVSRCWMTGVLLISTSVGQTQAAVCTTQSAIKRQPVVELYTSEGCSSCPPAEAWLSNNFGATDPNAIALAFHVVYWDYLGWKDQAAKPEFTQRQRWLSAKQGSSTIYTPGLYLSGSEWREWGDSLNAKKQVSQLRQLDSPVILRIEQDESTGQFTAAMRTSDLSITNTESKPSAQLFVATTRVPYSTKVTSGENRGETLKHSHVVRQWLGPFERTSSTIANASGLTTSDDIAIIAIAQDPKTGKILQALKTKVIAKGASCSP